MKLPLTQWTPKRERYCQECAKWIVANDMDVPPQAAMLELYKKAFEWENQGVNTLRVDSGKLFHSDMFQERLREIIAENAEAAKVSKGLILKESRNIAAFDMTAILQSDGTYKPLKEWPKDAGKAVKSIELDDVGQIKRVLIWDKNANLDRLARIQGMYEDSMSIHHTVDELDPTLDPADAYKKLMSEQTNS